MTARLRDHAIVLALVGLFVVLSLSSEAFLTSRNLLNILEQWAPVAIMALGGTFVLIAGGFDLSIGAVFVLAGIVSIEVTDATSVVPGVLAGVVAGAGLGLFNGLLTTAGRMNVFVATLGTSIVFSGLAAATTGGAIQIANDPGYGFVQHEPLGISLAIWVLAGVFAAGAFVLARTTYGRHVFAIGGSEEAARLSGVRVHLVRSFAFALSGLGGGIAAVLVASRSLSANANVNLAMEFNVWTAMLIGGNSMLGGEGAVWRTIVGVLLLALIGNGFNLLEVDPLYQQVVTGTILLAAVGLDAWARREQR